MTYPDNFEQKIGFNDIRKLLKGRCLSSLGTAEVDKISFQDKASIIKEMLQQTHEFRTILMVEDEFPSDNYLDMRDSLIRSQVKGVYLEESDLFSLKSSLMTIASIVDFFHQDDMEDNDDSNCKYPVLKKLTQDVSCFPLIIEKIDSILNKFGKMKDNASPELSLIRTELATTKRNISISLHSILHKAQQEGYVEKDVAPTFRDGRLVIPVIPALKRKIRGIIHDESASGKTVYVEPAEVVEANNRIRELELEERRAIIAILIETTEFIRPHVQELLQSYHFLGKIDFIRAKAILAESLDCIEPNVEDFPMMDWIQSVHPLLQITLKKYGKKMSPLDIALNQKNRIVLISGPNAGGKSVCLKTAGLLQYMLQCGLSVPMNPNSRMGIFDKIFIDIGDEQSIENDLSTYSSHLLNMKNMMKMADNRSMILIDEFGGGTEPQIGAAIAQAILGRFLERKVYGIITTHYQNLKYFAENHTGIINGAMLYDRQLMQPLFQLQIGHAGSSFAIEIARKIGIPEEVIREASETVGSDYIQSDKYVQDIVRDKRYWENKRSNIHQREKYLEELIARYEKDVKELDQSRKDVLRKAKEQAESILNESNAQIEDTIRSIREARAEKEQTKRIRQNFDDFKVSVAQTDANELEERIAKKIQQIQARRERQQQRKNKRNINSTISPTNSTLSSSTSPITELKVGMFVKIKGQTSIGKILKIDNKSALLAVGMMQLNIAINRLIPTDEPDKKSSPVEFSFIGRETRDEIYEKKLKFRPEIDVRGMSGEEAMNAVTYFIDDAILLNISRVRILHGTGTGYLRQIIRQYLRSVPNVSDSHDEHIQFGGAGITVVHFK